METEKIHIGADVATGAWLHIPGNVGSVDGQNEPAQIVDGIDCSGLPWKGQSLHAIDVENILQGYDAKNVRARKSTHSRTGKALDVVFLDASQASAFAKQCAIAFNVRIKAKSAYGCKIVSVPV